MSSPTDIVLALDAGATRTRAWIVRNDGTVLARGMGGPCNVYDLGVDVARRVMADATLAAWREAGLPGDKPCAFLGVFAGVAGAGAAEDQRALASALAAEFGVSPLNTAVDHDLRIAQAGAHAGEPGVVVVAGTGSAAYGRHRDGRAAKAGGWGPILDDGGSGHWIGIQAMRLVARVADGRAESTPLAGRVLAQLEVSGPREMLNRLRPDHPHRWMRSTIAALAPLVVIAAETGDTAATEILERGATELAGMAAAAYRRLNDAASGSPLPVSVAGGLLEEHEMYAELVAGAVAARLQGVTLRPPALRPVAGAALLALALAGTTATPEIVERLRAPAITPVA